MRLIFRATGASAWLVALALVALASQSHAAAQATAAAQDDDAARSHFRLGQAHYENGSFAQAAAEFEEAYRLSRRPQLLYNVFVAHRDAGQLQQATEALRAYLELVPDAENGAMLRARLASMERLLEGQEAAAPEDEAGATDASDASLDADAIDDTDSSAMASGTTTSARPSAAPAASTTSSSSGGGGGMSPVGFIVGGAGLALTIAGAITGGVAMGMQDSLDSRCPNRACPAGEGLESERDTGAALAIATDVLIITGVATLATGVVLLFVLGEDAPDEAPVALGCGPQGCDAGMRLRF